MSNLPLEIPGGLRMLVAGLPDFWAGPYMSVAEANTAIPPLIRIQTRFVHIIDEGEGKLYWYRDGITDEHLVEFTSGGSGSSDGGILTSEAQVAVATVGKLYGVELPSADSQLGIMNYSLIVNRLGDPDEVGQLAFGVKDSIPHIWVRTGTSDGVSATFNNWSLVGKEVFPAGTITSTALALLPANSDISGKSALEVLDLAINAELFQTAAGITAPSNTFTISPSGLQEVGTVLTIVKTRAFNRGAISPQYQSATAFRSGELVDYTEVGNDGTHTVTLGLQSWTSKANYSEGTLIKGSKGTTAVIAGVVNPLPAGSTGVITRTITGVYPVYATTANISLYTKLGLLAHGADIDVNKMVAETAGAKQSIRIPQEWGTISSLQQLNELSGQWDNIDLSSFTKTAVQLTINGSTVNYWEYTHNGATIGSRRLKFRL